MNLIMVYDTETSGLPDWSAPSSAEHQPHICQAAAILVDADTRAVISSFDLTAKPDGWEIPDEVAEIHGITTERALAVGVPEMHVVSALWAFMQIAQRRIGHNQSFDARIVRIALKRFTDDEAADEWKAMPAECTQKMATPIVKMAPTAKMLAAGRHHPKTVKLSEAYEFFIGKPLEGAHTAMADTLACAAVYWAIKDQEQAQPAPDPKAAESEQSGDRPKDSDDGVSFL